MWLPRSPALTDLQFGQWIEECSEPGQSFISDNWVSNETAYADHLDFLAKTIPKGSVYVGVGPEQNFSYMAALQPCYAFIVDIRRGNLLQHLYFKFLFEECATPQQWLAALLSRSYDANWCTKTLPQWLDALQQAPPDPRARQLEIRFKRRLVAMNIDIRRREWGFLHKMRHEFAANGLDLRFVYRIPAAGQPVFPSFREVLLSQDSRQQYRNFLATPEAYHRVRTMQLQNRVIPVVGDFAGSRALSQISTLLRRQNLKVGLFYASNVEFYLMPKQLPGDKMEYGINELRARLTELQRRLIAVGLIEVEFRQYGDGSNRLGSSVSSDANAIGE